MIKTVIWQKLSEFIFFGILLCYKPYYAIHIIRNRHLAKTSEFHISWYTFHSSIGMPTYKNNTACYIVSKDTDAFILLIEMNVYKNIEH